MTYDKFPSPTSWIYAVSLVFVEKSKNREASLRALRFYPLRMLPRV